METEKLRAVKLWIGSAGYFEHKNKPVPRNRNCSKYHGNCVAQNFRETTSPI